MFRRFVIVASSLLALGFCLAACSSTAQNFDPTDWVPTDWFDKKDKLPGERKPVFPNGVPGVSQGVPPDLVKGHDQTATETPAPAPEPAPVQPSKPKAKTASARPQPKPAAPAPTQSQQPSTSPATVPNQNAWPPPDPNAFSR
ncbi:MAG TPA: hypothetical protein VFA53_10070 [Xanthobacteraceae bacterium]|nr:hypothetical protein [Xanthobacteraceae bacterium]